MAKKKKPVPVMGRPYVAGDTQYSLCVRCKHKFKNRGACAAFPDGIPGEFASAGRSEHRQPYPGDNGVMFEEMDR